MQSKRRGIPSPALIVAALALVVAMAGTAMAGQGPLAKITKKKVKTIAAQQIADAAPTLSVGSADKAKIASNILSANVQSDGNMLGSIPAGATSSKVATGDYRVDFGRSIAGCTISASAASNTGPDLGFVAVGVAPDGKLQVFTRSTTNVVIDRPFYVQAICPA